MAGSYKHVVTDDGNLGSSEHVVSMLENGGDVFEAVEEMYGMIWYLASYLVQLDDGVAEEAVALYRQRMKSVVEEARQHYKEGLTIAKDINRRRGDDNS